MPFNLPTFAYNAVVVATQNEPFNDPAFYGTCDCVVDIRKHPHARRRSPEALSGAQRRRMTVWLRRRAPAMRISGQNEYSITWLKADKLPTMRKAHQIATD